MLDREEILFMNQNGYFRTPHILQVEITNRCSLSCPQCYKDKKNEGDMELELFQKILGEADDIGIRTLMLNGGEPFQHKMICDILKELEKYNFQVHCISSGLGLTDDIVEFLKSTKVDFKLNISLNGSTEEINQYSRDGYYIALNAIKRLVSKNIKIGINWVCRHDNVQDFPNIIDFAKKNNVKWVNIAANKLSGFNQIISPLNTEDYKFLRNYIEEQIAIDPGFIRIQFCYSLLNALRSRGINRHLNACGAGMMACNVDIRGDFRPCTHLSYPEHFDSIMEYWNQSVTLNELRKSKKENKKCTGCQKVENCYFCKAMFVNTATDFYAEPDDCPLKQFYAI